MDKEQKIRRCIVYSTLGIAIAFSCLLLYINLIDTKQEVVAEQEKPEHKEEEKEEEIVFEDTTDYSTKWKEEDKKDKEGVVRLLFDDILPYTVPIGEPFRVNGLTIKAILKEQVAKYKDVRSIGSGFYVYDITITNNTGKIFDTSVYSLVGLVDENGYFNAPVFEKKDNKKVKLWNGQTKTYRVAFHKLNEAQPLLGVQLVDDNIFLRWDENGTFQGQGDINSIVVKKQSERVKSQEQTEKYNEQEEKDTDKIDYSEFKYPQITEESVVEGVLALKETDFETPVDILSTDKVEMITHVDLEDN